MARRKDPQQKESKGKSGEMRWDRVILMMGQDENHGGSRDTTYAIRAWIMHVCLSVTLRSPAPLLRCAWSILIFNNWLHNHYLPLRCNTKIASSRWSIISFTLNTFPECVQPHIWPFLFSHNLLLLCMYSVSVYPFLHLVTNKQ